MPVFDDLDILFEDDEERSHELDAYEIELEEIENDLHNHNGDGGDQKCMKSK